MESGDGERGGEGREGKIKEGEKGGRKSLPLQNYI